MHGMQTTLWIVPTQDYLRLNVLEYTSGLFQFQTPPTFLAALHVALMTGHGIRTPPTQGRLYLPSAEESSDHLAVQHQPREVTSMCTERQANCFSRACAPYILNIRGNNLTMHFKGARAICQKHKELPLVGILSKEGAPVAGKLVGRCDTTSYSRSSVTPGSRFQAILNVLIPYDI